MAGPPSDDNQVAAFFMEGFHAGACYRSRIDGRLRHDPARLFLADSDPCEGDRSASEKDIRRIRERGPIARSHALKIARLLSRASVQKVDRELSPPILPEALLIQHEYPVAPGNPMNMDPPEVLTIPTAGPKSPGLTGL